MASTQLDPPLKELTRKLFWAIISTFPDLSSEERTHTFTWAANMADKIMARPSASRSSPKTHQNTSSRGEVGLDARRANRYARQAEGRGGGRLNVSSVKGRRSSQPSRADAAAAHLPAFSAEQKAMKGRALAYMMAQGNGGWGRSREETDGSSDSPSSEGGGGGRSRGSAAST